MLFPSCELLDPINLQVNNVSGRQIHFYVISIKNVTSQNKSLLQYLEIIRLLINKNGGKSSITMSFSYINANSI